MNNVKKMSIIWGIIMVIIFSILTFFGLKWKDKYKGYFDLEKELVNKTQSYFEINHSYPEGNNVVKITYDELKNNNVIDELKYQDDICKGYVEIKNKGIMEYKGYIKCNNYETKGYQE